MNPVEIMKDAFAPFLDGEKKPLNAGEVMNLWLFLNGAQQFLREEQMAYNMAQDEELKEKLNDLIQNVHEPAVNELKNFLAEEGIPLPQALPEKPPVQNQTVHDAAKLSDQEIANLVTNNINIGITYATRGLTEASRADVSFMFAKFHMTKVMFGLTLKPLLENKGWLQAPPPFR